MVAEHHAWGSSGLRRSSGAIDSPAGSFPAAFRSSCLSWPRGGRRKANAAGSVSEHAAGDTAGARRRAEGRRGRSHAQAANAGAGPPRSVCQPDVHAHRRPGASWRCSGLFYISTFIDASDKLFKGSASAGTVMQSARLPDAAVRLFRDPDRGAAQRAGDLRPAVSHQRTDGHEGLRHQSVSHRAPGRSAVAALQRGIVRTRPGHPRARKSPRQCARRSDPRQTAKDLQPDEPPVGHRARREHLSLWVLRCPAQHVDLADGVPSGARCLAARVADLCDNGRIPQHLDGAERLDAGVWRGPREVARVCATTDAPRSRRSISGPRKRKWI